MPNDEDNEIIHEMVAESAEQLDDIADDISTLEKTMDDETINRIFRVFHSIKGNISMVGFSRCSQFAHKAEDVVSLLRDGKLTPDKNVSETLLKSLDTLHALLEDIKEKGDDERDFGEIYGKLEQIEASVSPIAAEPSSTVDIPEMERNYKNREKEISKEVIVDRALHVKREQSSLRILIAEDNFHSRLLMQEILSSMGSVYAVGNGEEAVFAFLDALNRNSPYDLICLDIDMPVKDGQAALAEIRAIEKSKGTAPGKGVRVIMTTAMTDAKNVAKSFYEMCDGYIFKPISVSKLETHLKKFGML